MNDCLGWYKGYWWARRATSSPLPYLFPQSLAPQAHPSPWSSPLCEALAVYALPWSSGWYLLLRTESWQILSSPRAGASGRWTPLGSWNWWCLLAGRGDGRPGVWYKLASRGREGLWKPALRPEGVARGLKGRFSQTLPGRGLLVGLRAHQLTLYHSLQYTIQQQLVTKGNFRLCCKWKY